MTIFRFDFINIISPFDSKLANLIFESGSYLNILKIAKTIPAYQSGDSKLMFNYKRISLLLDPYESKINFFIPSKSSPKAALNLFKGYLNNRKQRIFVDGYYSDMKKH